MAPSMFIKPESFNHLTESQICKWRQFTYNNLNKKTNFTLQDLRQFAITTPPSIDDLMIEINDKIKEKPTEEKTETQNKNWLNWDEVMKIYNEMKDNLKLNKTKITEKQYDDLLNYVLLSLYVLIPPRRNLDWQKMAITFNSDITNDKYNYLDYNKKIYNI